MTSTNSAIDQIPTVFDKWCERRALKPLSILLPGWFCINGLTDGWQIFRESLRHVKAMCREEITQDEMQIILYAIAELDQALFK